MILSRFKYLFILLWFFPTLSQAQIDSRATYEARALYQNLLEVSHENLLFGHQDDLAYGIGWWDEPGRSDVKEVCGDYPAVFGWDLGDIHKSTNLDGVSFENIKGWIKEAHGMGGINTISLHLDNPVTGGSAWDNSVAVKHILPGGAFHDTYKNTLNLIGDFLKDLKTDGGVFIPIILRPYHEHSQSWPWWGTASCTEEEYNALWKMTVHHFKDTLDIHHLLYAISPQDVISGEAYFDRYPGDDYVDILGLDYYKTYSEAHLPNFRKALDMLGREADRRTKVAALTETGQEGIPIKTWWTDFLYDAFSYSQYSKKIAWALVWRNANINHYFAPYPGEASVSNFMEFYGQSDTYFNNDLPDMYTLSSNDTSPPLLSLETETSFTSYDNEVEIKVISDERAYLNYSFSDITYSDMEHEFLSGQGGYTHKTTITAEHGNEYTVFIRGADIHDNYSTSSVVITFSVDTTKQLATWKQYDYYDDEWDEGAAPLGFNSEGLITIVSDHHTIYFRKKIVLPDTLNGLGLLIKGHDGFVIYLNGVELDRINMKSSGNIEYDTYALSDNPVSEVVILGEDDLSRLNEENIIAIEVHKTATDNPDISFDARLFNNEGIYLDLGSTWKFFDKGEEPEVQILSSIEEYDNPNFPEGFVLHQNYPNPFNAVTTIRYKVETHHDASLQTVNLSIYNLLGQKITTLVSERQPAGRYSVQWDAGYLPSGIYFYRLEVEDERRIIHCRIRKMILIK